MSIGIYKIKNLRFKNLNKFKIFVPKRTLITVPKKDILIVLPFLGQFSLILRSRLYNCFNKTPPQCNTKVIF